MNICSLNEIDLYNFYYHSLWCLYFYWKKRHFLFIISIDGRAPLNGNRIAYWISIWQSDDGLWIRMRVMRTTEQHTIIKFNLKKRSTSEDSRGREGCKQCEWVMTCRYKCALSHLLLQTRLELSRGVLLHAHVYQRRNKEAMIRWDDL